MLNVEDEEPEPGPTDAERRRVRFPRRWWLAIPLVVGVVGLAAALAVVQRSRPARATAMTTAIRFTLPYPEDTRPLDGAQFAPSPDGTAIAVAARGPDGQSRLWIRRLQALDWQELPRTAGAMYPFWSPDSRHIGFFANRRLERVDVENGLTQTVSDAPDGRGGTWGIDGDIVFAPGASGPLSRVPASGGRPVPITQLDRGRMEVAHLWPRFLADGRRVLYFANAVNRGNAASYVTDLSSGERRSILSRDVAAVPVADLLLFSQNRALMAQRFQLRSQRLEDRVDAIGGAGAVGGPMAYGPSFSASAGLLVYRNMRPRLSRLAWVDASGRFVDEAGPPAEYRAASLSPDGTRVVVAQGGSGTDTSELWLLDAMRGTSMRLTFGAHQDATPIWSPDAQRIAFVSRRDGRVMLMTTSAAGGGTEQEIATWPFGVELTDWSRDGRALIFTARNPKTGLDVWLKPMTGDDKPLPLLQSSSDESDARVSPDGRWIAYVSNESGIDQIYVRTFPPPGSVWQVSTNGGTRPRWRGDGRELFFVAPDGALTAVGVTTGASLVLGPARALLRLHEATGFEVQPGGRFLVSLPAVQDAGSHLHVIANWTSELSERR